MTIPFLSAFRMVVSVLNVREAGACLRVLPGKKASRQVLPLLVLPLAFFGAPETQAQDVPHETAFETLRMGVAGGVVFRQRGMQEWSPGAGARLTLVTPYAGGRLRFDGSYRSWMGQDGATGIIDRNGGVSTADLPDVQTVDVLAGWGLSNAPDAVISLEAGLLLGNRFMLFDLPVGTAGRLESEMLAGPWVRVGRALGKVRVFGEVRALRVLTRPRWDTVGISGGFSLETPTPGWIRWILR